MCSHKQNVAKNMNGKSLLVFGRRSNEEGSGNTLQYSCLENPMDGGVWWATVHGAAKSPTGLTDITFTFFFHHNIRNVNLQVAVDVNREMHNWNLFTRC